MICTKSQIKMFESVVVMIIFFILLMFGFIFYEKVVKHTTRSDSEEQAQLKAIEVAQKISFLPELMCTSGDEIENYDCIDLLKLKNASKIIRENQEHYHDIFGYVNVTLVQVYPAASKNWTLYENPLPSNSTKSKLRSYIPTVIYDAMDSDSSCAGIGKGSCSFGVLIVEVYS